VTVGRSTALLSAASLSKRFGGLLALDHLSLDVQEGSITALIGPNGAGKTTCFNCLTGHLEADAGTVRLAGVDLSGKAPHRRARLGLGRTFQRLEVFARMTVAENLQVAAECGRRGMGLALWRDLLRVRHRPEGGVLAAVEQTLRLLGLDRLHDTVAGDLPTGQLRLVELGRALCAQPRVLLLDEPASGLDSHETQRFEAVLRAVRDAGTTILLVEHDVDLVRALSDQVYVLDFGRLIAVGTPAEVSADPQVRMAYLGVEEGQDAAAARA
jgi:branched-chain amino acid transport system ATP-binding protein